MGQTDIESLCSKFKSQLDCAFDVYTEIRNDDTFVISPDRLKVVVEMLNEHFDGVHLSTITAQQREAQVDVIEVMYNFYQGVGFSLMISLPTKAPEVTSIVSIIPGADFYEREVAEMFGVKFTGRSETPPLLLPDDWDQGPPFIRNEVNND